MLLGFRFFSVGYTQLFFNTCSHILDMLVFRFVLLNKIRRNVNPVVFLAVFVLLKLCECFYARGSS